ncbi:MAG TPA: hypothetical protein V6C78_09330 [Crinalium sp.]
MQPPQQDAIVARISDRDHFNTNLNILRPARIVSAILIMQMGGSPSARFWSEPGAIFEAPEAEPESLPNPSYNLHDFRWDHVLAAGRKIFSEFPRDVTVYLIEAENLSFSLDLSPIVERSSHIVFSKIIERLKTVPMQNL